MSKVTQAGKDLIKDEEYLRSAVIMKRKICQRARYPADVEYEIPRRVMKILNKKCCLGDPWNIVLQIENREPKDLIERS